MLSHNLRFPLKGKTAYLKFDFGDVSMLPPESELKGCFGFTKETIPAFQLTTTTTTVACCYTEDGRETKRKYVFALVNSERINRVALRGILRQICLERD
jgi:hypothetical protein